MATIEANFFNLLIKKTGPAIIFWVKKGFENVQIEQFGL